MTVKIAINGLGRIGRCVLRHYFESGRTDVEIVAINASGDINKHLHLLKYDSVHGVFDGEITGDENSVTINGKKLVRFNDRDPAKIDWASAGADIVLECTGFFKKHAEASKYLEGGAKKVIISDRKSVG